MRDLIDKLLQHFTGEEHVKEVALARKEFSEKAGVLDQTNEGFDMKMSQFADWYLFSRPRTDTGQTPIEMMEPASLGFTSEEIDGVEKLRNSRHGIFEFIKIKGEDIYIKELFSNEKIIIKKSPFSVGFDRVELFEARLIPVLDTYEFAPVFCFHPSQATRYILKEVKRVRKIKDKLEQKIEQESVIAKLFRMKYKLDQYKHVKVEEIYSKSPKIKV